MSRPNTRIARIARVRYPERPAALDAVGGPVLSPGPAAIDFTDGSAARLPPPAAAAAALLEALRDAGEPAYLMMEGDTIRRVFAPIVGRVDRCTEGEGGRLQIGIDASPRALWLRLVDDYSAGLRPVLSRALDSREVLLVAANRRGEVVDAEPASPEDALLAPDFTAVGAEPLDRIPTATVAPADLDDLFALVAAHDCRRRPPSPCIPFDYPDTGCDARAHKMCEVLGDHGIVAGKVWVFDGPEARTVNVPGCVVQWFWHVAAFVRVAGETGTAAVRVLDPSVHTESVSLGRFRAGLGVRASAVRFSAMAIYQMGQDGRGVTALPGQSDKDLPKYRACAALRRPPPPYGPC